ncbi:MAG: zinc ABC transporter substrate-binding protein [Paracoccus sp. (in: a-proteobacteria)]|uniref:zinc ABC transporter substrate-binding protein n=1 Tax=Paracoccus sp. TaxID=267 RepID=UPI0026E0921B|nr:zinc ABC transporter substrate-binding protein [Paracoccus sp. (in: a-proteobacteria)]MDO5620441.1 zinc ABC transporter substrate-binding protein [Paracoccus sp. (in: a-proteobacteria)]
MTRSACLLPLLLLTSPALAEPLRIVTDTEMTASLVRMVGGDLVAPVALMPQGGDPHHYQLRPSQAGALQDADLLVWVGPELTPWLERARDGLAKGDNLALLTVPGTRLRDWDGSEAHTDHHDHDHSHDGIDPHAFLDPGNGQLWLSGIAEALAKQDGANASTYRANADTGRALLTTLDAELATQMAPLADQGFVVFHDAYGYFTNHYGMRPAMALALGDATPPSAARLARLRADLAANHATCAFPEANHNPRQIEAFVAGTDLRIGAALDPSGAALPAGADLYPQILRQMAQVLHDCMAPE